ncbi:MAG: OmpA family protein [Bacteroidota bacterium]|nr:OmpA family protein [Bacteroidota bacterium]MDP4214654.1 OmpA family protein [Bacteroidota bacterium]MDP4247990.1 OmpA family protein [Bacteroidota bacterium]MDP4253466.1 OmpA family protein [Bacteroidota bacterium]MDP4258937.1 OmpA family protein [Bacteroidota bacterium]
MSLKHVLFFSAFSLLLFSCVSSKKFKAAQAKIDSLTAANAKLAGDLKNCNDLTAQDANQRATMQNQLDALNKQIDFLKANHDATLKQLQDLSVISSSQAESIKKSLDNIGSKDAYIQNLQTELAHKDSLNMALVMNLKGAIGNLDDKDINIKVDKGVIYIDISDKLLFKSGSYDVTDAAKAVLGKVAAVLKAQSDIEFMVEGHTDNKNYARPPYLLDNWDLSVKRATSIVRILQKQYGLDPAHITAAGRSEFVPVATNDTEEGRAANRRTRIVILPQLDQFFKLLEKK